MHKRVFSCHGSYHFDQNQIHVDIASVMGLLSCFFFDIIYFLYLNFVSTFVMCLCIMKKCFFKINVF